MCFDRIYRKIRSHLINPLKMDIVIYDNKNIDDDGDDEFYELRYINLKVNINNKTYGGI
jgi:hypothetical protein